MRRCRASQQKAAGGGQQRSVNTGRRQSERPAAANVAWHGMAGLGLP